mgnify:CR=1 FL=1
MEKTQRDEKESVAGEVAADDERIGIAFRWSMRVLTSLALLGIIIGLVVYLQRTGLAITPRKGPAPLGPGTHVILEIGGL